LFFLLMSGVGQLIYGYWSPESAVVRLVPPWNFIDLRRTGTEVAGMLIIMGVMASYTWVRKRLHLSRDPKMHDLLALIYLVAAGAPLLLLLLPWNMAYFVGIMALPQFIMMMMMSTMTTQRRRRLPTQTVELFGGRMPDPIAPLIQSPSGDPEGVRVSESSRPPSGSSTSAQESSLSANDILRRAEELRLAEQAADRSKTGGARRPRASNRTERPNSGFGRRTSLSSQS
ncbi:MAG: hypothetical protein AAFU56_09325, partial [Pseudomonadota bacterium]